jgi:hypothetical protein
MLRLNCEQMRKMLFSRSRVLKAIGYLLLVFSVYSLMGFFQGVMLFAGERALKNANLWGSAFLIGVVVSSVCFYNANSRQTTIPTKFQPIHWLLVCSATVTVIWLVVPVFNDLWAIDSCLDAGGSFDHVYSLCDFSQSHKQMSVVTRQGFRIVASAMIVVMMGICITRRWIARRLSKLPNE